jgi:hypothetical protein
MALITSKLIKLIGVIIRTLVETVLVIRVLFKHFVQLQDVRR